LESLALAIERGDYALADTLAVSQSENLDEIGLDRLQRIIATVPRAELAHFPFLGGLIAIVYHSRPETRAKGVEYFAIVVGALKARQAVADPADRLALRALESMALRWSGEGEAAALAARAALKHLDASLGRTPIEGMIWHLTRQMAISLFMVGDVHDAVATMERAWASDRDGVAGRLGADARLALFHAVSGDIDLAEGRTDSLPPDTALTNAIGIYGAASGVLARALTSLESGDLEGCDARLRWLDGEMKTNEMWPMHALGDAVLRLLRGKGATVNTYLESLLRPGSRCPTTSLWRDRITAMRALGALSTGGADEAHRILNGLPTHDPAVLHISATVKIAEGRYAEALEGLGRHRPDLSPSARADATHSLLAAVCAARTGSVDGARLDLERWAGIASRSGTRTAWLLVSADDRELARSLVSHSPAAAWMDRLSDIPAVVPSGLDGARLSEREIVVLQAVAESGRIVSAARDLFVSPNTIKTQLRSIYRKLGVDNRLDALSEASRRGLLR
jgi:LuxR family maltose regulon positive regulatory protein